MKPTYCPNCGKQFPDTKSATFRVIDQDRIVSYDCHCKECEWSGYVSPDDEN